MKAYTKTKVVIQFATWRLPKYKIDPASFLSRYHLSTKQGGYFHGSS